jgi:hypothetical protein
MMTVNPESGAATKCPNCNTVARAGELVCRNCSFPLNGGGLSNATRTLEKAEETFELTRSKTIGSAIGKLQKVSLIIDATVTAPIPDVDLTRFDADNLGVSRQHIELSWRSGLIYVADMGSTNGTLLNGQRLDAGIERILRDNDVLVIGHMRTIVHFVNS